MHTNKHILLQEFHFRHFKILLECKIMHFEIFHLVASYPRASWLNRMTKKWPWTKIPVDGCKASSPQATCTEKELHVQCQHRETGKQKFSWWLSLGTRHSSPCPYHCWGIHRATSTKCHVGFQLLPSPIHHMDGGSTLHILKKSWVHI